ncbi:basic proline-rich protein-like [Lathamus discolor]|uniref:basic proline-rich protein-like n=1 Tax=Lathamus discolor TaxID=678569 RepID=UPI0032B77FE2
MNSQARQTPKDPPPPRPLRAPLPAAQLRSHPAPSGQSPARRGAGGARGTLRGQGYFGTGFPLSALGGGGGVRPKRRPGTAPLRPPPAATPAAGGAGPRPGRHRQTKEPRAAKEPRRQPRDNGQRPPSPRRPRRRHCCPRPPHGRARPGLTSAAAAAAAGSGRPHRATRGGTGRTTGAGLARGPAARRHFNASRPPSALSPPPPPSPRPRAAWKYPSATAPPPPPPSPRRSRYIDAAAPGRRCRRGGASRAAAAAAAAAAVVVVAPPPPGAHGDNRVRQDSGEGEQAQCGAEERVNHGARTCSAYCRRGANFLAGVFGSHSLPMWPLKPSQPLAARC